MTEYDFGRERERDLEGGMLLAPRDSGGGLP
jgi:hypothetical protein